MGLVGGIDKLLTQQKNQHHSVLVFLIWVQGLVSIFSAGSRKKIDVRRGRSLAGSARPRCI